MPTSINVCFKHFYYVKSGVTPTVDNISKNKLMLSHVEAIVCNYVAVWILNI